MVHHWPRAEIVRVTLLTICSVFVSFRPLIYHGFYPFLAMVYRCFRNYLLCFRVFLVNLQVHECFEGNGDFGVFWS